MTLCNAAHRHGPLPSVQVPLFEVVEPRDQEELLQEELRVQNSDVGGAADQGVGCVGQSVENVLSDQPALFRLQQWPQEAVDHLGVYGAFRGEEMVLQ